MLDVQAVGDIFAAPNPKLVFDAMKLADKGHGVLLLTLNYAGDQLAGKQAMKLASKAGLKRPPGGHRRGDQLDPTARTINGDWQGLSLFTISPQPQPERERALTRWLRSQSAMQRTWPPSP